MTKELELTLQEGIYCVRAGREVRGELVEYWRPVLCEGFVKVIMKEVRERIKVMITDERLVDDTGVAAIELQKQGYYRWSWRFLTLGHKQKNTSHGMYRGVEDILMGMYPNEWDKRENGKDPIFLNGEGIEEGHLLWIRIESLA